MIYQQLTLAARRPPSDVCLFDGEESWTSTELCERVDNLAHRLTSCEGRMCGIATASAANLLIALGAIEAVGGVPVLLPSNCRPGNAHVPKLATTLCDDCVGGNAVIEVQATETIRSTTNSGSFILFTSGTSGSPKPFEQTWVSLTAATKLGDAYRDRRWLLAYDPRTFAGLQVILQSLLTGGTLIATTRTPQGDAEQLIRHEVEFASATPTYWRSLLNSVSLATLQCLRLRQITLGGEIADQLLLDRLCDTFPETRITHIYASTELGVCYSVHDGRAGFPQHWIDKPPAACRLRIADNGELQIKRPTADDWFKTGDLVETVDDRVLFIGRKSDTIHIGGQKILPTHIENVIRLVPDVIEARVFGVDSSITGQVAAAEIQLACDSDESLVRDKILTACREHLPKQMMPATLSFSTQSLTTGDKLRRQT